MNDRIDVYTVVGAMMLLLFILGEGYGIGAMGVFSSATGLLVGASGASLVPGLLLMLLILSFVFSSNLGFRDIAAIAVVVLFIILSVSV
jgi:hypothetical protein